MEHGSPQSWDDMERVWAYMYGRDQLNTVSGDHPILITEAPLNPTTTKLRTAEVFFENFNVPALYFAAQSILSLYASGRTTGVVLDIGDGATHCVPVYEGYALPHAISRTDIAGREITMYLQMLLRRCGTTLVSSSELEIVREMKESCAYVIADPHTSMSIIGGSMKKDVPKVSYKLPDGSSVELKNEPWQAPEVLFQPLIIGSEAYGVQDCLMSSIMRSDCDMRKSLFSQIVLSGGTSLLPGLGDRLLLELKRHRLAPKDTKIRIAAPPERLITTWVGGSILSSLSTFKSMWVTRKDYEEEGERILTASSSI
jgi:centractin